MKEHDRPAPPPPGSDGGITIHNRLDRSHRYQAAIDQVTRAALRGLPGPWDVSAYAVGRAWFRIDVVAPDGASWSASVPVHQGPRAEDLADTIRTACLRHCRLRSAKGTPGAVTSGRRSAGTDDGGPSAGPPPGEVGPAPSPADAEGTPK